MSEGPVVLATVEDGVGRLTFNRPMQRNAMSIDMMALLYDHLAAMDANPAVRCIVLTGAGDHFVAGGDLKAWDRLRAMSAQERADDFRARLSRVRPLILLLETLKVPLIAAVRGFAAGAGLCFVAAADIVLADETARFLFANVRTSLVPDMGLTHFLPRAVGDRQAARLSMLSGQIDAVEAKALGLVTDLVAPEQFEANLSAICSKLRSLPAASIIETKRLIRRPDPETLGRRFDSEVDGLATTSATDDFVEALSAFLDKRKPVFGRT